MFRVSGSILRKHFNSGLRFNGLKFNVLQLDKPLSLCKSHEPLIGRQTTKP
jgi:hypothetical protein